MEHRIEGNTQGWWCPRCRQWGVVASYMPPILGDRQIYDVHIGELPDPTPEQLRLIARATGSNLLQARRATMAGPLLLFSGVADDVLPLRLLLEQHGLPHEITPGFRWTAQDASGTLRVDSPWHARQAKADQA